MGAITIRNVRKQFDTQVVLRDISLDLHGQEIVGLVGSNGSGKTTLLRLLAGTLELDQGEIFRTRDVEIGYLPQVPQVDLSRTLHEEVGSAFDELLVLEKKIHDLSDQLAADHEGPEAGEWMKKIDRLTTQFETAGGYTFAQRLDEIIAGLGFSKADHALPMSALSGGQKCRAALAKLLLKQSTFLLLDEPTNHLDIGAVRWLEGFLAKHQGGAVIVSHDRYLLDRVVDRIVELDRSSVTGYPGGYTNYVETKELRRLTQERQYTKDKEFIESERAFIAKHLAGQRTKEAQGRRTRLDRRIANGEFVLERPTAARRSAQFKFSKVQTEDSTALRVDGLAKSYGENKLFADVSFQVFAKERFAITGPNGTGKSTLLKIILGEVEADNGRIEFGRKAIPGYYAQDTVDLNIEHTVLEEMRVAYPELTEHEARSLVARFNFTGDDVFKRIGLLSGGEQSRLRLLKLILSAPNVLVLDEPTNHLDIASCEALEESLSQYPGTILVVSHDRYFLDRVADRLLVVERNGHAVYGGNYSYYVGETESAKAEVRPVVVKTVVTKPPKAKRPTAPPGSSKFDRVAVEDIESYIIEREDCIARLQERFGDSRICRDPVALSELRAEIEGIRAEIAVAEHCWNERAGH